MLRGLIFQVRTNGDYYNKDILTGHTNKSHIIILVTGHNSIPFASLIFCDSYSQKA